MANIDKFIIVLSLVDSLHDFYKLDTNKQILQLLYKFYNHHVDLKYNIKLKNIFDDIKDIDKLKNLNKLLVEPINVNTTKINKEIKDFVFSHNERKGLHIDKLNDKIYDNFNIIFNVSLGSTIFNKKSNLKDLLSYDQKIMLRQSLYFLIDKYDESIIIFILKYMNIDNNIYNQSVINKIKEQIKNNVLNFYKIYNITYPITYFSDMASGLKARYFKFNIINVDKDKIDAAKVAKTDKQFEHYEYGKYNKHLFIGDDKKHLLGFTVARNYDKISIFDFDFYLEGDLITCSHKNIKLIIKKNSVGRNTKPQKEIDEIDESEEAEEAEEVEEAEEAEEAEEVEDVDEIEKISDENEINKGIYQLTQILINIFTKVYKNIDNKNIIYIDKNIKYGKEYISSIKNHFDKLIDKINILNKYDFKKISTDVMQHAIRIHYGIYKFTKKNKYNDYLNKISYIKNDSLDIIKIKVFDKTNIKKINSFIEKLNNFSLFLNLLESVNVYKNNINNKLKKVNKNNIDELKEQYTKQKIIILDETKLFDEYLYLINSIANESNTNYELLLFFDELYKNKTELEEFFDIDNLYIQLYNIYTEYKTEQKTEQEQLELCQGCIIFILFGFKRFGDWIQGYLSKKFYFMLETKDFYCQLYAYLIDAPIMIDDIIYNYDKVDIKKDIDINLFRVLSHNNQSVKLADYDKKSIIYSGLRDIKTDGINRAYFDKYLKYKKKYLQLKKQSNI